MSSNGAETNALWKRFLSALRSCDPPLSFHEIALASDRAAVIAHVMGLDPHLDAVEVAETETCWIDLIASRGVSDDVGLLGPCPFEELLREVSAAIHGVTGGLLEWCEPSESFIYNNTYGNESLALALEKSTPLVDCASAYVKLCDVSRSTDFVGLRTLEAFAEGLSRELQRYSTYVEDALVLVRKKIGNAIPSMATLSKRLGNALMPCRDHIFAVLFVSEQVTMALLDGSRSTRLLDCLTDIRSEAHGTTQSAQVAEVASALLAAALDPLCHALFSWIVDGRIDEGMTSELFVEACRESPTLISYRVIERRVPKLLGDSARQICRIGAFRASGKTTSGEHIPLVPLTYITSATDIRDSILQGGGAAFFPFLAMESSSCGHLALRRALPSLEQFHDQIKEVIGGESQLWETWFEHLLEATLLSSESTKSLDARVERILKGPHAAQMFERVLTSTVAGETTACIRVDFSASATIDSADSEWNATGPELPFPPMLCAKAQRFTKHHPLTLRAEMLSNLHRAIGRARIDVCPHPLLSIVVPREVRDSLSEMATLWMQMQWAKFAVSRATFLGRLDRRQWPVEFSYLRPLEVVAFRGLRIVSGLCCAFATHADDILSTITSIRDRAATDTGVTDRHLVAPSLITVDDAASSISSSVANVAESMGLDTRLCELSAIAGYVGGALTSVIAASFARSVVVELHLSELNDPDIDRAIEEEVPRRRRIIQAHTDKLAPLLRRLEERLLSIQHPAKTSILSPEMQRITNIVSGLATFASWATV